MRITVHHFAIAVVLFIVEVDDSVIPIQVALANYSVIGGTLFGDSQPVFIAVNNGVYNSILP